jgi:hypothetical protein
MLLHGADAWAAAVVPAEVVAVGSGAHLSDHLNDRNADERRLFEQLAKTRGTARGQVDLLRRKL